MAQKPWFEVDRKGLAQVVARRGKRFLLYELVQNAWDEASTQVEITVEAGRNGAYGRIVVSDDNPEGFKDISHAYTLFAPSQKKGDAEKRGRFNMGEKLVIASCKEATIITTKGTVYFNADGTRSKSTSGTDKGSRFCGTVRLTRDEEADLLEAASQLIPPPKVRTIVNMLEIAQRDPIKSFEVVLPTEIADAEGYMHRAQRKAVVCIYEPMPDETPMLYEMGIPVVETDDRWHVNVLQKVPLNMDRDNVPNSYLKTIRVHVANHMAEQLSQEDANTWGREALSDERCAPDTVHKLVELRFGDKAVVHDMRDAEANALAVTKGYTVVTGSQLSGDEWDSVRRAEALLPAGKVTPSPKPFSPDGRALRELPLEKQTEAMAHFISLAKRLAHALLGERNLHVVLANDVSWPFIGAYGNGVLYVNVARVGKAWFEKPTSADVLRFLIHEFGHSVEGNHLSEKYHDALCKLGARMAEIALTNPAIFNY